MKGSFLKATGTAAGVGMAATKVANRFSVSALIFAFGVFSCLQAAAQCPADELISGLMIPLGITQSNKKNLIVGESGTVALHSGRLSIVGLDGDRRTLLDGLPSAINDVNDPSGPAGVFMRGRTLYVAIGVGDAIDPGPFPGTTVANPNPSSPIFSSVLAVHFSADVEKQTEGFILTPADQQALAAGEKVVLGTGGDKVTVELVVNFPNFVPAPLPTFADNVAGSNPFDLVAVEDQLYVTDGGMNLLWRVDLATGNFSIHATFPPITNPLFNPTPPPPSVGPPFSQAVPTGVAYSNGQSLVTLFRGAPFAPGTSTIEAIDPVTGEHSSLISGLKTAIDVLPLVSDEDTDYLVLQHASVGPFFGSPGLLLRFETPTSSAEILADCLTRPTSMALDEKTNTLYVTELSGRIVSFTDIR